MINSYTFIFISQSDSKSTCEHKLPSYTFIFISQSDSKSTCEHKLPSPLLCTKLN
jgi:hypothetical protein